MWSLQRRLVALLKACAQQKDVPQGTSLHADICKLGLLEKDLYLASSLVNMYAKCGALAEAQQVLGGLPARDVFSWTSLITGYTEHGQGEKALKCFHEMQSEGHSPDAITFACALKACAGIGAVDKGKQIHDEIVRQGLLQSNIVLGNALVDMYAKCGAMGKAQAVLVELPLRDVVSWNALIAGYAQHGQGEEALNSFNKMLCEGQAPNAVSFTCALKACADMGALVKGEQIHDDIIRLGLLQRHILLGTALVDMYAKCGAFGKAQEVLDGLPVRSAATWNALITGYAQYGQGEEALKSFDQMQREGHSPNAVTFTCTLKACADIGALVKGEQIHDDIMRLGLLQRDTLLGTAVVDMYAKCGAFDKARGVLDELPVQSAATWNALISGYAQHGLGEEALKSFDQMQCEGHSPNAITFSCALKVCADIGALFKGEKIHDVITRLDLLQRDVVLGNTLMDMYAKCGAMGKAQGVLDGLPCRDVVSWNALIAGYAQHGPGEEALKSFDKMQSEGHSPNAVSFICALKACADIGALAKGQQVHDEIVRLGWLQSDILLGTAVVDMYAKCGAFGKAQGVLDELPVRNAITWNALITGYALHGQIGNALDCFEQMQHEGVSPDPSSFVCMLNACSHSGLLDEGQMYFTKMSTKLGIRPDVRHYCCLVDLFGRAGEFDKALEVINRMPSCDDRPVWMVLLGACQKWKNVKLGRVAFNHALRLDKNDTGAYICMANIYAAVGLEEDADRIEVMRVANKGLKESTSSWWTDAIGTIHSFLVGDSKYPHSIHAYSYKTLHAK